MKYMIFNGEQHTDLLEPLELGRKGRRINELALMEGLIPLLHTFVQGCDISGLAVYE